jgi:hypothetical protein
MNAARVWGDTPRHTINIDWDGTAVPAMWPERPTEFMPGFERAMRRLNAAGIKLQIFTARISPYDPWTGQRRDPGLVQTEIAYIRDMLDRHGLTFVGVWTREGKPGGSRYVDDKGVRYGGRTRSWDRLTDRLLLELGAEAPMFPALPEEEE